ncbi:MAG TPA: type II secretion system protein GspC [Candidatus Competibacteraceae bacterium]|nr:type II secretion system protein GspC [Candidatus Competibacteraceae bacterium]MCP5132195.1 type II secretion system protein GspC [Gammaproteobacteria bacterium]HRY18955.1 type II secretion system protein GspC [Candidatus Competibacteraceae bacterium]
MAVIAVNMLLVIALAHTLAKLTLAILTGEPASLTYMKTQPVTGAATDGVSASQSADVSAIGAWHLFGKAEVDRPVAASPVAVPVTPLNLRLAGIFFAEHSDGLALIADGNNLERGYRIGDLLPGGARLERIEREQVIVSRNGREELIKLPKLDDPGRPLLVLAPESPPALLVPAEEPGPVAFSGPQVIDASAIAERLRGEVLSQPQALEDIAFANPYMQNGSFAGFRLRPGRDRQIFQQLGLSSGDILTEINGTRLSSPAQGLALLQELMSARQINVRIQRNGAEIPLTFILDGS